MNWLKRVGFGALVLIAASVAYVAIDHPGRISVGDTDTANPEDPAIKANKDPGVVSVSYMDTSNPEHRAIRANLESWRGFEEAAEEIDAEFLVPHDLHIVFSDCGEPNALYDPAQKALFMCYELVSSLIRDFHLYAESDSALAVSVWQTTFFVFYHELGHALIDMLDLPVTGREEDAVDQLATLVLLEAGEEGRDAALAGAAWFELTSQRASTRLPFWDEHSLDPQRYFNIICWVYGSDTTSHQELLGREWGLPRERAERCPGEYDRMSRAWASMLAQYRH